MTILIVLFLFLIFFLMALPVAVMWLSDGNAHWKGL